MTIREQELLVLRKQVFQVAAIRQVKACPPVRNVTRDRRTSRVIAAKVKKIQQAFVTTPAAVRLIKATAVQVPIPDVVAGVFFDQHPPKEERHKINKFLIDEVTVGDVYHAVLIQFRLPPPQECACVCAGVDADEAQVDLSGAENVTVIRHQTVVGIVCIQMRSENDVVVGKAFVELVKRSGY